MSCSEIINVCVSVVSILIALFALFQTNRQISLSNKQQLFDRRLSRYIEFTVIYNLYTANKQHLKDEKALYYTNDLIFSRLTNCSELETMIHAVKNPLHQDEQNVFLKKYEELKNTAIEISMIFDGNTAKVVGEFVLSYADLLNAMYKQQAFISKIEKPNEIDSKPLSSEVFESKCKEMAEKVGLFRVRDKLESLDEEIRGKNIIGNMKDSLRLTKVTK